LELKIDYVGYCLESKKKLIIFLNLFGYKLIQKILHLISHTFASEAIIAIEIFPCEAREHLLKWPVHPR